ncbi:MAG: hypothetical protein Q7R41_15890 [Phycisphaerales bacterium]|nr:hypothetical protein [Phycisphaerales bacterium]
MMSSKNRTYMVLMSVGAAALFVDRCVLTGGTPAPASAEVASPLVGDAESPASHRPGGRADQNHPGAPVLRTTSPLEKGGLRGVAAEELSIPELPFPRNLDPFDPSAPIRDIFARSQSAATETTDQAASDSPETSAKPDEKRRIGRMAFAAQHRLEAVMIQQSLKIAILDGRWMQVGDVVDGCTLSDISGESVVFRCRDGDALLSLFERTPPGDR